MRSHLEDDVLLDVIEGAASVEATRHARGVRASAPAGWPAPARDWRWPPGRTRRSRLRCSGTRSAGGSHPPSRRSRLRRRFGGFFVPALLAAGRGGRGA